MKEPHEKGIGIPGTPYLIPLGIPGTPYLIPLRLRLGAVLGRADEEDQRFQVLLSSSASFRLGPHANRFVTASTKTLHPNR